MDLSRFKEFFKSYKSLLLPGIIGLTAVLVFVPTRLMSHKLKSQIEEQSVSMWNSLNSLRDTVSKEQWKTEQDYQERHQQDANSIAKLFKQTTERELLSYQIFPEPRDTSHMIFYSFSRDFKQSIDELVERANAGECPSKAQLSEIGKRWDTGSYRRSRRSRDNRDKMGVSVKDRLCRGKAESISIYANPADLDVYHYWDEFNYSERGREKSIEDCWYTQLAYWIVEDVYDTAIAVNGSSQSVPDSPVKRILEITFGKGQGSHRGIGGARASFDRPYYVLSAEEGLTLSYSKRYTGEQIDVVHFKVSLVVTSSSILPVIQEFSSGKEHTFKGWQGNEPEQTYKHNQITVLEYDISPVIRREGRHELYRYGQQAVVELELTCEYIFVKEAYEAVKPQTVKDAVQKRMNKIGKSTGRGR